MNVRRLALAIWRLVTSSIGSAIISTSSLATRAAWRLRRRRKSSAQLCAIRNSQPSGLPISLADTNDSTALTKASCNTSSPSITEPTMRAQ